MYIHVYTNNNMKCICIYIILYYIDVYICIYLPIINEHIYLSSILYHLPIYLLA